MFSLGLLSDILLTEQELVLVTNTEMLIISYCTANPKGALISHLSIL